MRDGVYREQAVAADLAAHVACSWYRRIGEAEAARPVRIVPDGCIDLIWKRGELRIAGPDTTPWISREPAGAEIAGLRFRSGAATAILGVPATELVNDRPDAAAVWGRPARELVGRLEAAASVEAATDVLRAAVRRHLREATPLDPVVQHVAASVRQAGGSASFRVNHLANHVGLSERQLHRRCRAALGYGPMTLARIVRLQRFLARVRDGAPRSLADAAIELGYADQSHLTRDVRALTGLPPAALLAEYAD